VYRKKDDLHQGADRRWYAFVELVELVRVTGEHLARRFGGVVAEHR